MNQRQAWYQRWGVVRKTFPGHRGRPGQVGGSLPREGAVSPPDKKPPKKKKQPPDMSIWTPAQHKKAVSTLAKKSVKELRRRQDLVFNQQKQTFQELKGTKDPIVRERLERAVRNLNVMEQHLVAAIDKKVFG